MKIKVSPDGTVNVYDEIGQLLGHFGDEASAKEWVKVACNKEHVEELIKVAEHEGQHRKGKEHAAHKKGARKTEHSP